MPKIIIFVCCGFYSRLTGFSVSSSLCVNDLFCALLLIWSISVNVDNIVDQIQIPTSNPLHPSEAQFDAAGPRRWLYPAGAPC